MNSKIFIPTREEFKDILSETVDQLLARRIPQIIRQANRKDYLTTAELKELTGFSYRVQKYHRDKGNLTFIHEGRKFLYPVDDVERFMNERKIEFK